MSIFGWSAELFVEIMNKITNKKNSPPPVLPETYDPTMLKLMEDADEFVEVDEFIENLDTLEAVKIKVYTIFEGDVLEVTFANGVRNKILTSSFSTSLENISFASQINSYMQTHKSRIKGVKITKLGNKRYDIDFTFEEIK